MKPKVKKSQVVYSGYFTLKEDILEKPDGATHPYTSMHLNTDAVTILAQNKEGLWILNREYRHPTGHVLLGAPGGRLDPGESPLVGAQRELLEETGYWSDDLSVIGASYPFSGLCSQKIYFILAKNCFKKEKPHLDPFEFIEIELKTDAELKKEILSGDAVDGILCAALWYKEQLC